VADLRSSKVLYLKGALFVVLGGMASGLLLWEHPTLKTALLLCLAVWGFARAYYFAFYVIQHYIDGTFRYSGLWAFLKYIVRSRDASPPPRGP
jgi:hypothetical protein